MSYPDLGCFAECLECEICDEPLDLGDDDPDIDYDEGDSDGDGVPDWADPDWGPDPDGDSGDMWDDFPDGIPLGDDWTVTPTWNPWGFELEWEF